MYKKAEVAGHKRRNYFVYACYAIVTALILAEIWQNLLVSESLRVLIFREVDDLAFQHVLRRIHVTLYNGRYSDLWQLNDYGYGWIYWIVIAIVTFPLYIISENYGLDRPLIVAPRQISLIFSVLSLIIMARLLRKSGVSAPNVAVATMMLCLFPTMGYFSMRFGTVSAVSFFSLLSFYFAWTDKPSTNSGRIWAMLSLAVAGAIKLNGLLIAPVIGGLMIIHSSDRSIGGMVKSMIVPGAIFILCLVVLTNPALLYSPFNRAIFDNYIAIIKFYIVGNASVRDAMLPLERFYIGAFGSVMNAVAMGLLALGILIAIIHDKQRRGDYIIIATGASFMAVYLILTVKYPAGIMLYITAGLFVLILGTAGWGIVRNGHLVICTIAGLLAVDALDRAIKHFDAGTQSWGHLSYLAQYQSLPPRVQSSQEINKCIPSIKQKKWSGHILVDSTLPLLANGLTNPAACFSVAWGHLSSDKRYCKKAIDYIVLDKRAPGAQSEEEFAQYLADKRPDMIPDLMNDRKARLDLLSTGKFGDQQFSLKCETDGAKIFTSR